MLPATVVDEVLAQMLPLLETGDIVIDGGNSYYRDDIRRATALQDGAHYPEVGASGAFAGLEHGYCLMIGGEKDIVQHLDPVLPRLPPAWAPHSQSAQGRRRRRTGLLALRSSPEPGTSSRWSTMRSNVA